MHETSRKLAFSVNPAGMPNGTLGNCGVHETSRRLGDVRNTLCVPARELVRTVCFSRLDGTHLAECAAVGDTLCEHCFVPLRTITLSYTLELGIISYLLMMLTLSLNISNDRIFMRGRDRECSVFLTPAHKVGE